MTAMNTTMPRNDVVTGLLWLSGIYAHELSAEQIAFFRSDEGEAFLDWLSQLSREPDAVAQIRSALAAPVEESSLAIDLAGEYASLFLGVGNRMNCLPYEAMWRGESRLWGASTKRVDALLESHGLKNDTPEPSDHIAVQLQLMAHLVSGGSVDAAMLKSQLAEWAPAFCDSVQTHDSRGFYAGVAAVTRSLLS